MKARFLLIGLVLFAATAFAGYSVNTIEPVNNTNSSDATPLVEFNATITDLNYFVGDQATVGWAFDDVVGYWDMNDYGTTFVDVYGGNNGTFSGETFNDGTLTNMDDNDWVQGKFGSALEFDGDNDYVELEDTLGLIDMRNPFSFSLWVKYDGVVNISDSTKYENVFCTGTGPSGAYNDGFGIGLRHAHCGVGGLRFRVCGSGVGCSECTDSVSDGEWHHIVVTSNGTSNDGNVVIYQNGTYVSNKVMTPSVNETTANLVVGRSFVSWNGSVDDIRLYNRTLSAGEVEAIYNSYAVGGVSADHENRFIREGLVGYWRFDEAQGSTAYDTHHVKTRDNLVSSAGWSWSEEQEHLNALTFDGEDDTVTLDDSKMNGSSFDAQITMKTWFKPKNIGTTQMLLTIEDDLKMYLSGNNLNCLLKNDTANSDLARYDISALENTWIHGVCTYNADTDHCIRLYVNSVLVDDDDCSLTGDTRDRTGVGCEIGSNRNLQDYFNGSIDDVQFYDRALTQAEITELYNRSVKARGNIAANNTNTSMTMENNEDTGQGLTDTTYWWWARLDNRYITNLTSPYLLLIDTTPPTINLSSPANNTVSTALPWDENVSINYTETDDNSDSCWYEHDGSNNTLTGNTTAEFDGGWHNITLYCNDTSGNTASQTNLFFVDTHTVVTGYDSEDNQQFCQWNFTINTTNYQITPIIYHNFEDGTEDTEWSFTTSTGGGGTVDHYESNGYQFLEAAGSTSGHTAEINASLSENITGYNITIQDRMYTQENLAGMNATAALRLYDGTNYHNLYTITGDTDENNTFLLYYIESNSSYTLYINDTYETNIDVSGWTTTQLDFWASIDTGAAAGLARARHYIYSLVAPCTANVNASDVGTGSNTLEYLGNSEYIWYTHEPEDFTITVPTANTTTTSITLQRAGFELNAYNEQNTSQNITFNATIYNSTSTHTLTNQTGTYTHWFNHTNGTWSIPTGEITVLIEKTDWASRSYNVTVNPYYYATLNAYLLESGEGIWATFYTVDNNWNPVQNATITFYKTIGATTTQVAQTTTDTFGVIQIYLDPLVTYDYTASKLTFETETGTVTPISTEYYIVMTSLENEIDYQNRDDYFYHYLHPTSGRIDPDTTEFKYFIYDPMNGIDWFELNITHSNGTALFHSNVTGSPSGGSITVNASTLGIADMNFGETINAHATYHRTTSPSRTYSTEQTFSAILEHTITEADATSRGIVRISTELGAGTGMLETFSIFLLVLAAGAIGGIAGTGGGLAVIAIGAAMCYFGWLSWTSYMLAAALAVLVFVTIGRGTA